MTTNDHTSGYTFTAIRGIQARREYFISMCPLRLIPQLFKLTEKETNPFMRALRTLNKGRIPEMMQYITANRDSYIFSAITASVDSEKHFQSVGDTGNYNKMGILIIPKKARIIINDGQHRRAAIEAAIRQSPEIGYETIPIVFFLDKGIQRSQQMFADLNRHAIRPSRSINRLFDHRDNLANLSRNLVMQSKFLPNIVEMEKSTLSKSSRKLSTLSAFYGGNAELLSNVTSFGKGTTDLIRYFWESITQQFPDWKKVRNGESSASELRQIYIHSHGIILHSLGILGRFLINNDNNWENTIKGLIQIDWSRSNLMWEGRAMSADRISQTGYNIQLTTNAIKQSLTIPLSPEEQRIESNFKRAQNDH